MRARRWNATGGGAPLLVGLPEQILSAPGKLFLAGEYAVLWGGVARVAAVGPRTFAWVRRREDREVHLIVEEGRLSGRTTPLGVHWEREIPGSHRFAAITLDLALRLEGREAPGFELALSPSPVSSSGLKLGMGGSGRTAVLAAAAERFALGGAGADPLKLALFGHTHAQGGKGSGGDVAASFSGGWIRYRRFPVEALLEKATSPILRQVWSASPPVDVTPLPPPRLSLLYAFSGASASTPSLIAQAERKLSPEARRAFVVRSDGHGATLERGLLEGDLPAVASACEALVALFGELGSLVPESMARILSLAREHGAAGKPSGAGGGDGCILFCPDPSHRSALAGALQRRGVYAQPLELEAGLRVEPRIPAELQGWLS